MLNEKKQIDLPVGTETWIKISLKIKREKWNICWTYSLIIQVEEKQFNDVNYIQITYSFRCWKQRWEVAQRRNSTHAKRTFLWLQSCNSGSCFLWHTVWKCCNVKISRNTVLTWNTAICSEMEKKNCSSELWVLILMFKYIIQALFLLLGV